MKRDELVRDISISHIKIHSNNRWLRVYVMGSLSISCIEIEKTINLYIGIIISHKNLMGR